MIPILYQNHQNSQRYSSACKILKGKSFRPRFLSPSQNSNQIEEDQNTVRQKLSLKGSLSPPSPRKHRRDAPPKRRWPQKRNTWVLGNLDPTEKERWGREHTGGLWREWESRLHVKAFHMNQHSSPWKSRVLTVIDEMHSGDGLYLRLSGGEGKKDGPNVSTPVMPAISLLTGNWAEPFDSQRIRHKWKHKPSCWMKFSYIAHFIKSKKLSIAICNVYKEEINNQNWESN